MAICCFFCGKELQKYQYRTINITKGDAAKFFNLDIGNSLSRDFRVHEDCAQVVKVTMRITGLKADGESFR